MEDQLACADLDYIAFVQHAVGGQLPVDKSACCRVVIADLVIASWEFANGGVQSADCEIFQKDITFPAAPNGHFGEQFDAAENLAGLHARHIEAGAGPGWWIMGAGHQEFAATRGGQLKGPGAFTGKKGYRGRTKEELIATVQDLLLEDRFAIDKAIAAAVIVAQDIVVANT